MSFLSRWAHDIEHGAARIGHAVEGEATWAVAHPGAALRAVGHGVVAGAEKVYDLAIGDDLRTVMNPKASTFDRVLAGVSLASNFVGPEGKLIDRGVTELVKAVAQNGGKDLAEKGIGALEKTLGKETVKMLAEHGGSVAEALEKALDYAEKGLDRLTIARGVVDGAKKVIEDTKQTIGDVQKALAATTPADRVAAWERVAKDVAQFGADTATTIGAAKSGADALHAPTLATLQNRAEGTLLQDAARIKSEGRTFVQGDTLLLDVRDSKNFQTRTMAKLETLAVEAKAEGRTMVVYDPNVSKEQAAALLAKGISVAKSESDLRTLSVASHVPHGIEVVNMAASARNGDLLRAANQRREQNETRDSASSVYGDIAGTSHANAVPWDGKSPREGRVTAVDSNGSFEISVGRNHYVTFDPEQQKRLGIDPKDVRVGSYVDVARGPDPAHDLHAAVAPTPQPVAARGPADQHAGATR